MPALMPRYLRAVTVLLQALTALCALLAAPALAQSTHIAAELVAERPAAPSETVTLAIAMRPAPGWHGYWQNPGDAGLGMRLEWQLTYGASAGPMQYPVPEALLISGLMNHVYQRDYAVLVPLTVPRDARPGSLLPVAVSAQWLACTEQICVPEQARLATAVRVVAPDSMGASSAQREPRFDGWRARLPAPLGAQAHFAVSGTAIRLAIPLPASLPLAAPHVFAATDRLVDYAAPQRFARAGDLLLVTIPRARLAPLSPATFPAVLKLDAAGDGLSFAATPGPVPLGGVPLATDADGPARLGWLLLAAIAGGVLLNVMPCVFPILSLKALSLARAGESAAGARAEGLAYTAGVMLACLALGGVLLGLRAAGQQVGWAFQLQEPLVVAALLALAVAITANLAGLFEFAVPGFVSRSATPNHGVAGAFLTGLLAAFVATPCTGPFMATAMGAALLLPVAQAMLLFAALGLGIALPFLAIAFVPALRRALPRPGAWMNRMRQALAVPMALTGLALLWLASRLAGWGYATACAVVALGVLALLARLGRKQRAGLSAPPGLLAGAVGLLVVAAVALPHLRGEPATADAGLLRARPYSDSALAGARAGGHPVFAYFTADWCLTCKVNERVAIEREATRSAFDRARVVVLRGDWTRRDPAITRYLTAHGAAGVPLYVWYPAGSQANLPPERVLPQVLSPELLGDLAHATK